MNFGFECKVTCNNKQVITLGKNPKGQQYCPIDVTEYLNGKTLAQDIDIDISMNSSIKQKFAIVVCRVQRLTKAKMLQTRKNLMIEQLISRVVDSRQSFNLMQGIQFKQLFKDALRKQVSYFLSDDSPNLDDKWTTVRGLECEHLQCFQLEGYLEKNLEYQKQIKDGKAPADKDEKFKPWKCQFCGNNAIEFVKDKLFQDVVEYMVKTCKGLKNEKIQRQIEKFVNDSINDKKFAEATQKIRRLDRDQQVYKRIYGTPSRELINHNVYAWNPNGLSEEPKQTPEVTPKEASETSPVLDKTSEKDKKLKDQVKPGLKSNQTNQKSSENRKEEAKDDESSGSSDHSHSWESICYNCNVKDKLNRKLLLCEGFDQKTDDPEKQRCTKVSHIKCAGLMREPNEEWFCKHHDPNYESEEQESGEASMKESDLQKSVRSDKEKEQTQKKESEVAQNTT